MKYRPEIDGLRAIAVTSVILFHAKIAGFSGGFVGVDVFFVISGFLITRILIGELGAGDFSIARFYERRARRILPALYLVLAASTLMAFYLMLPSGLMEFSRSVMATLLFVSNIWFWWRGSDYFSPAADRDPMLHTWSLGVEEQYYLVFPLLMLVLWRFGRGRTALVIALLSALSLMLAEIGWRVLPEASFFLLPTRVWQLGLGALGAFAWSRPGGIAAGRAASETAAAAGLLLVLGSIFLMDEGIPFPSLAAAIPTGGALLILLFATEATLVGRLLAFRPMVVIGLMSYGAYLWHQPVLAFARIAAPDVLSLGQKLALCGLTFALAWPTLLYVERPFRDRSFLSQRRIFAASAAGGLVLLLVAGLSWRAHGFIDLYPPHLRETASISPVTAGQYVRAAYDAHGQGDFTTSAAPRLLVIGDSFSQDFYNMIRETGAFPGYQIALRYVLARCQIHLGPENISGFIEPGDRRLCLDQPKGIDLVNIARRADVIVFAFSWREWSAERMGTTLANFRFHPDQTALVLGGKRFDSVNRSVIAGRSLEELASLRLETSATQMRTSEALRRAVPPESLVDTQRLICDGSRCPLFTPQGALISPDGAHLTRAGAKYVGDLLFADPRLAPFAGGRSVPEPASGGTPVEGSAFPSRVPRG